MRCLILVFRMLQVTKSLLTEGDKFEVYGLVRNRERAVKAIGKLIM